MREPGRARADLELRLPSRAKRVRVFVLAPRGCVSVCVRGGACVLCSQVNGARGPARGSRFGAHQGLRVRVWAQGTGCVGGSGRREGAQVPGISPLRSLPWKLRRGEGRRGPDRGCARGPRLGALAAWGRSPVRAGLREGRGKPSRTGSFGIHSRAVLRSDRCRPPAQNRGRSPQCC